MAHYLDDFLFCGERNTGRCKLILDTFHSIVDELGLPLAEEEMERPTTALTFLGIELDTVQQTSKLPEKNLADLKVRLASMLQKKVTLRELQEMVGHLNFACRMVAPGCTFLRRLCTTMQGHNHPFHRTRVTQGMRENLKVWGQFLAEFNAISFWRGERMLRVVSGPVRHCSLLGV